MFLYECLVSSCTTYTRLHTHYFLTSPFVDLPRFILVAGWVLEWSGLLASPGSTTAPHCLVSSGFSSPPAVVGCSSRGWGFASVGRGSHCTSSAAGKRRSGCCWSCSSWGVAVEGVAVPSPLLLRLSSPCSWHHFRVEEMKMLDSKKQSKKSSLKTVREEFKWLQNLSDLKGD